MKEPSLLVSSFFFLLVLPVSVAAAGVGLEALSPELFGSGFNPEAICQTNVPDYLPGNCIRPER